MFVFAVADTLARFEEDARRFLFPEPKLVPTSSGVEREVLMTRAPYFPVGPHITLKGQCVAFIVTSSGDVADYNELNATFTYSFLSKHVGDYEPEFGLSIRGYCRNIVAQHGRPCGRGPGSLIM